MLDLKSMLSYPLKYVHAITVNYSVVVDTAQNPKTKKNKKTHREKNILISG